MNIKTQQVFKNYNKPILISCGDSHDPGCVVGDSGVDAGETRLEAAVTPRDNAHNDVGEEDRGATVAVASVSGRSTSTEHVLGDFRSA